MSVAELDDLVDASSMSVSIHVKSEDEEGSCVSRVMVDEC